MSSFWFYFGLGFQIMGFTSVGICLFAGLNSGDYNKVQLFQFIGGMVLFYLGSLFRNKIAR